MTRAFEDVGAVSPATALPLHDIVGADPALVVQLAARRQVREAGEGRYYLYTGTDHARRRLLLIVLTTVVLLAGPAILIQFVGR